MIDFEPTEEQALRTEEHPHGELRVREARGSVVLYSKMVEAIIRRLIVAGSSNRCIRH